VSAGDRDPALRHFERDMVLACLLVAALGFLVVAVAGGGARDAGRAALSVLGGGLLVGVSYHAIRGAVDLMVGTAEGTRRRGIDDSVAQDQGPPAPDAQADGDPRSAEAFRPVLSPARRAVLAVKFFTRYALLAVAAYAMLTCFRLHPVGLLAGASAPFFAALMQVARMARARARPPHP
jgi:hypothetical protein